MTTPDDKRLMNHEYDGIREYDNPTPGWWKLIFVGCVIWAIGYWFYYHGGPGLSESETYAEEEKAFKASFAAQTGGAASADALEKLAADPAIVATGKKVFDSRCASCHRMDGGGQVGPNLTDNHQIHGSTAADLHNTIRVGVQEKGMMAWGPVLQPEELDAVTAYVVTLRGKNVAGGKAAEGQPIPGAGAGAEAEAQH